METYEEIIERQQKDYDDFIKGKVFYAFSKEQFNEGMQTLGLDYEKEDDIKKLASFVGGGYILKDYVKDFNNFLEAQHKEIEDRIEEDTTGSEFIAKMFKYELANHEYGYTRDLEPTLRALALTEEDIIKRPNLKEGLRIALEEYREA